jgi:hypothetical protein
MCCAAAFKERPTNLVAFWLVEMHGFLLRAWASLSKLNNEEATARYSAFGNM